MNIDTLTEEELIQLNHRIVERLKFLRNIKNNALMLEFKIGDQVSFQSDLGHTIEGMIIRLNKKTVTVLTEDHHHWNVPPGVLRKIKGVPSALHREMDNLLSLNKKQKQVSQK